MFADDIALVATSEEDLRVLVAITVRYFNDHRLKLSVKKTKLMTNPVGEGQITFLGDNTDGPLKIELVSQFKYLGIRFNSQPYHLFSDFQASIVEKCD